MMSRGRAITRDRYATVLRVARAAWCAAALSAACLCSAAPDDAAAALRARFEALRQRGSETLFDRPMVLQSTETGDRAQGDVFALVGHPYLPVRETLMRAEPWCALLMLHLNMQYCRVGGSAGSPVLEVGIGRKFDQPLRDLSWLTLGWQIVSASDERLGLVLQAPGGPFGTKDFRIEFEAVPFDAGRTLLHVGYGYGFGAAARWGMAAYLSTLGRGKVGFSIVGRDAQGKPQFVDGMRGLIERNTLRYHLAIETYLDAPGPTDAQSLRARLLAWFDATERYPQQLHELERGEYIAAKLAQVQRARTQPPPDR